MYIHIHYNLGCDDFICNIVYSLCQYMIILQLKQLRYMYTKRNEDNYTAYENVEGKRLLVLPSFQTKSCEHLSGVKVNAKL